MSELECASAGGAGVGANLLGQHAQDRNQDATVYVRNLDAQASCLLTLAVADASQLLQHTLCLCLWQGCARVSWQGLTPQEAVQQLARWLGLV